MICVHVHVFKSELNQLHFGQVNAWNCNSGVRPLAVGFTVATNCENSLIHSLVCVKMFTLLGNVITQSPMRPFKSNSHPAHKSEEKQLKCTFKHTFNSLKTDLNADIFIYLSIQQP